MMLYLQCCSLFGMKTPQRWKRQFKNINEILNLLAAGFFKANEQKIILENACNKVKYILNQKYSESFPYGQTGTSVNDLVDLLFKPNNILAHIKMY